MLYENILTAKEFQKRISEKGEMTILEKLDKQGNYQNYKVQYLNSQLRKKIVYVSVVEKTIPLQTGIETSDSQNVRYLFAGIENKIIIGIIKGEIDAVEYAKIELASRGLNEDGAWIGWK